MNQQKTWESELREAAAEAERELGRIIGYVNDSIIPEVRTRTAGALHTVAGELRRLADHLDAGRRENHP